MALGSGLLLLAMELNVKDTLVMLVPVLGVAAGALAAHAEIAVAWQFVAAAVGGGVTVPVWRRMSRRQCPASGSAHL